ncbi:MAG: hypothetical protein H8M99_11650 [Gloeobacteraceae cyanobacterium ES-bin-144]|nr:hypothetical protein [Verrucomicrobiales bacterium]
MNSITAPQHLRNRFGIWRYSSVELLIVILVLIIATPFMDEYGFGKILESVLLTIVLISGLFAVGGRRSVLAAGLIMLTPAVIGKWMHHFFPHLLPPTIFQFFGLIFIGFVIWNILHYILKSNRVDAEVLCASIAVYLLIGLLWAMAYMLIDNITPNSFLFSSLPENERSMSTFNAFFFSFSTLSSVGFGDVTPCSKVARMLSVMETVTGILYVAILISRLVASYSPKTKQTHSSDSKHK